MCDMPCPLHWPGPGPNNIPRKFVKQTKPGFHTHLVLVSTRVLDFVLNSFIFMSNSKSEPAKREPGTLEKRSNNYVRI